MTIYTQREMDFADSVKVVKEDVMLRLVRLAVKETGINNVCLAGGVALNCVGNGKVLRDGTVRNLWIQPAASDASGTLGAALVGQYLHLGCQRSAYHPDAMEGTYIGPDLSQSDIEARLKGAGAIFSVLDDDALFATCVEGLIMEKALGLIQGRMEFDPRAIGNRSILGDPRSPSMQSILSQKVKYRESFRPFAPVVLSEHVTELFELDTASPYMLLVANVSEAHRKPMTEAEMKVIGLDKLKVPHSDIPAVTHVDYSARIQTVHAATNPRFHSKTGCPILINTSFNVRGEPIVCNPEDAFRCFMGTEIELLAIGNCLLRKKEQNVGLNLNYETTFELD